MTPSTDRVERIASMYAAHADQLRAVVRKRGSANPQTVEDACAHAWSLLLGADHVDVRAPHWRALAWLTTTAVRRACQIEQDARRSAATEPAAIEERARQADRGVDDLVAERLRLDLVLQLPERPRRFLLRLALGYSYREIAAAEQASYTTTNKQIARAKRLLRDLDANDTSVAPAPPRCGHAGRALTGRREGALTAPQATTRPVRNRSAR